MKQVVEINKNSIEADIASELDSVLNIKNQDILQVVNSGIVILFWETGKKINDYKIIGSIFNINTLSAQLKKQYGSYFSVKNLKMMVEFASQFPDFSYVLTLSSFICWGHILILLRIKEYRLKIFYINHTIKEGLSADELKEKVDSELHIILQNEYSEVAILSFPELLKLRLKRSKIIMENVFKMPFLKSFRSLIELSANTKINNKRSNVFLHRGDLFKNLNDHVENYKYETNRWINSYINMSFWEIGKRINAEAHLRGLSSVYDKKSLIQKISFELGEDFKKSIDKGLLYGMAKFAEQFDDFEQAVQIAYLVNWEQILILLELKKADIIFFYGKLSETKGLSTALLKKEIAENSYQKNILSKGIEQSIKEKQNLVSKKRSIKKEKSSTFIIDTLYIKSSDKRTNNPALDIFNNPFFSLFLHH